MAVIVGVGVKVSFGVGVEVCPGNGVSFFKSGSIKAGSFVRKAERVMATIVPTWGFSPPGLDVGRAGMLQAVREKLIIASKII